MCKKERPMLTDECGNCTFVKVLSTEIEYWILQAFVVLGRILEKCVCAHVLSLQVLYYVPYICIIYVCACMCYNTHCSYTIAGLLKGTQSLLLSITSCCELWLVGWNSISFKQPIRLWSLRSAFSCLHLSSGMWLFFFFFLCFISSLALLLFTVIGRETDWYVLGK